MLDFMRDPESVAKVDARERGLAGGLETFGCMEIGVGVGRRSMGVAMAPRPTLCNLSSKSLMYQRQFSPDQSHIIRCVDSSFLKVSYRRLTFDADCRLISDLIRLLISSLALISIHTKLPVSMS